MSSDPTPEEPALQGSIHYGGKEDADAIVACVNFLRTHSTEIAGECWQPIETCPNVSNQRILLAWPDGTVEQGMWLENPGWKGYRPESLRPWPKGAPTHWRPLPAPPTLDSAMQHGGGGGE